MKSEHPILTLTAAPMLQGFRDERHQHGPAFDSKAVLNVIALRLNMAFGCSSGAKKLLQSLKSGLERLAAVGVRHCRLAS
jgi:hypothetical protein